MRALELATTKGVPDLSKLIMLIHGAPKIGKTPFVNKVYPKALNLNTDGGLKFIKALVPKDYPRIKNWVQLKKVVNALSPNDNNYDAIIVDLVEHTYQMCDEYICKKEGVLDLGEIGHGGGWKKLRKEYTWFLRTLVSLGKAIVLISHTVEQEIWASGKSNPTTKFVSALTPAAQKLINPWWDVCAFVTYDSVESKTGAIEEVRVIKTRPSLDYLAGCRGEDGKPFLPKVIRFSALSFKKAYQKALSS